ncbi:SusC/RagA family TonB-linked outer membrane protein [Pontibacter sp. HSC-36F09]|uniref:SusC/RagA family TonB-linked outer membrane protein n=1 Tax=Pontibacter sp. HSC-36F09 TaxID=2910966 RepID=UPI0020A20885|nr:SusC/RagA family TonB-linked outer membrane protein [Pontibacter sp. HSC-36F09]MCP2044421.1 TonB-linked SusC/RagA family outer membrane protein [Pontibacter sp. HSC-36F09]
MLLRTFTLLKRQLPALLLLLLCCQVAVAQSLSIQGKVTDEQGSGLPGASVAVKGTTNGTITDGNGNYKLSVRNQDDVLVVSFIGYLAQELPVGSKDFINIQLQPNQNQLNEVVVTALGIEREEKALGYATQTVSGESLTNARSNNFASALSGKVAGLSLVSPGSGPVNSTRISLRGDNSLDPNGNNALIILDGVPLNSGMTSSGVDNAYGAGSGNDIPVDFGNGIADINPDDIESITVLKGPSAAALYGSRAANGVLIITTKSGTNRKKGLGVTVNSNFSFNDVLQWPDYQYEYGQGTHELDKNGKPVYSYHVSEDSKNTGSTSSAYGPKFDGQYFYQYDPTLEGQSAERQLWRPYKDNIKGFFRTGSTITNSVAVDGGNDRGSARASLTHSKNEWIMPNTGFERMTAALSLNYNVSDKLKLNSKINFTHKKSDNLPGTGYSNQSIAYFMIFQNPNVDLAWYEPRWKAGKEQLEQIHPFSSYIDNPYVIAYEMTNAMNNYSTVGNLSATYEFSPKFDLLVRSALTTRQEDRAQRRPFDTANFPLGYYKEQNIFDYEINNDFLVTYKDKIGSDIDIRTSFGGNARREKYRLTNGVIDGLVIPAVYKLSNGLSNPMMTTNHSNKHVNSLYGLATFSYQDKVFVDVTGRNDWSSTLPVQNNSFFYPSISSSFILSDILTLPRQVSYAKLRLSAAKVGNDTSPYRTRKYYGQSDFAASGSVPTTLHNKDFKPELTTSYEAGLEYRLFQGRLGMDITLYQSFTENQILEIPLDPTTGYSRAVMNAGKVRNQGVELMVNATPIERSGFRWNTSVVWSKNDNKVMELAEDLGTDQQVLHMGGQASIIAKVGGSTGDIYGFGFVRSPDGQIVYDKAGLPAYPAETQYIGNAYADWKAGFNNEFTYKNFRFNVLLDGQYGGIIYSQTHHKMAEQGKLKSTLMGREDGFIIGDGVVDNGDGTFSPNTVKVKPQAYYTRYYRRANLESNSFDASFLKLREVRMEYNLPKTLLAKTRFINGASVALYGRDLAMISKFPIFDPETAALNGGTIMPGVEMGQMPSTRTFGMNVTLQL